MIISWELILVQSTIIGFITKMQNTCNLISQNSAHLSDVFTCFSSNIDVMWNARKPRGSRVDQHSVVLDLYSISINKIPLTEIMTERKFHWI